MKMFGKRLLAVLLTLALLLGLLPGMALAAEPGKVALDDAAGAYRVTVCTTATGLSYSRQCRKSCYGPNGGRRRTTILTPLPQTPGPTPIRPTAMGQVF